MEAEGEGAPPSAPIVVVGNGPAGLAVAAVLSGHLPFYHKQHPDKTVHEAVTAAINRAAAASGRAAGDISLVDVDLPRLVALLRLGGRGNNAVANFADALLRPGVDQGKHHPSVVEHRLVKRRALPVVLVGDGPPGGSWWAMPEDTPTLSPGGWMSLPGGEGTSFADFATQLGMVRTNTHPYARIRTLASCD